MGRFLRNAGRSKTVVFDDRKGWPTSTQQSVHGWDKRLVHSLTSTRLPSWRQIQHLPEVLTSSDGARLRLGALLLGVGLAVVAVAFYFSHTAFGPAVGGELVEAVVGTPRSLNPILAVSNDVDNDLTRLTYSRLFTVDGSGNLAKDLVADYGSTPDLKTYTLTIRDDAEWHDGQKLTVDDVLFTFSLIQDPAWKSPLYTTFKDVHVEKVDDRKIKLTLKQPYSQFLYLLDFGILPKHVWSGVDPQNESLTEADMKPVGSGPFKFGALSRDKRGFILSYSLKRNEDYYERPPYLEKITFQFFSDYASAIDALHKRQVTSMSFVPRDMRGELRGLSNVLPDALGLPQVTAVFFNPSKNAILKDEDVRRALIMSIDKVRIVFDAMGGDAHPIDHPALPGLSATSSNPVPFNPEGAAALLDHLGWKIDPSDGLRKRTDKKSKTPTTLSVILTIVDQPESRSVADIIKTGWSSLGVLVTVDAVAPSEMHRQVIVPRNYEALLYSQLLGPDSDPYPFWHSSQVADPGLNLAMFSDKEADAALEQARATSDASIRQEAYRKFLAVLADRLPAAFLYSPSYTYAIPSDLKGFSGNWVTNPSDRFATVTGWYLKTARSWKK